MVNQTLSFDIPGIISHQQNRYPMLFIDRITDCVPLKYAKGFKLFTYNEWYFQGYETASPFVWNVIQIEAMSQVFLMTFLTADEYRGHVATGSKFNKVQFFRKIEPGDRLDFEATLIEFEQGVASGKVNGKVNGKLACSMECTFDVPGLTGNNQQAHPDNATRDLNQIETLESKVDFGIEKIRECMLNRYPWLFLDRVIDIEPGKFVKAIKNFTYNEKFFPAHYSGDPSVPGFIQIECCMQCFLLTLLSLDEYKRRETADRMLKNVQLKRKIIPGDTLELFGNLERLSRGVAKGYVEGKVNGEEAVSFEVTAVIVDELDKFKPKVKQ